MKRRSFIQQSSAGLFGLSFSPLTRDLINFDPETFRSNRPPKEKRTFQSETIEEVIRGMKNKIKDPELFWLFENCFPNTLDTTVDYEERNGLPDTFIITGDIDAMWLRDSTAQVWPYLPFIQKDQRLGLMILGLIHRQAKCILTDPYANAFYKDLTKVSDWKSDIPSPKAGVHERKWEIDSLCYFIRLSDAYFKLTKDNSMFTKEWDMAAKMVIQTLRAEQRKNGESPYRFARKTTQMIDAPTFNGTGRPVKYTGLICSMFRPSDDATLYPYLIPSNLMAKQSIQQLGKLYEVRNLEPDFVKECLLFTEEIHQAIQQYAIREHLSYGAIYAYEIDGYGNASFMDDANVPSLMSLSYLGIHNANDPIYERTRVFLLSNNNPYFLAGSAAEGQASPHTGKDKIWPMGIILRAMTSVNDSEILYCLKTLRDTHANKGFMHEAFHKNDPTDFNRSWFAWANTLFGELILKIDKERPHLLKADLNEAY